MSKQWRSFFGLTIAIAVWNTLSFIIPDFIDNPVGDYRGVISLLFYVAALGIGQCLLALMFVFDKWCVAFVLPLYSLLGAVISYYRVMYHAAVNSVLVDATLHTNMGTVTGVVSWSLVVWVIFQLCVSVLWIWWRWKIGILPKRGVVGLVALCLFLVWFFGNDHLHKGAIQRYPMNVVHSIGEYIGMRRSLNLPRQLPVVCYAEPTDSLSVIMLIGESARADHLSLNGYERQTCSLLSQRSNVVSLPHVYSMYDHTAASVPHILTPADSLYPEKAYSSHSFIRCFQAVGYYTSWISNQDYGQTYSSFIHESDTIIFPNASKSSSVFAPWYDVDLLPVVESLSHQNHSAHNLYVLHLVGSHWYYNNHVPPYAERFKPVTTHRVFTQNDSLSIIHSYDNTIVALDYFVDSLIQIFEGRNAILFYLSDHGESLGENGHWLHAMGEDAVENKNPAAFVWFSDKYARNFPEKVSALRANREKRYNTDYLFYSILFAAGLEAEGDDKAVNIFR